MLLLELSVTVDCNSGCKTVTFLLKISFSNYRPFTLTVRTYLNTQKYGLFCSLIIAACIG